MTALRKYQRLESPGLWRADANRPLREVVVGLRETTLILTDPKTEMALTQWSLPALARLNHGQVPALFGPGGDDGETLEIDDPEMIEALEIVRYTLEKRRPREGWLRGVLIGSFGVVGVGLAVFWLPGKLVDYTAKMLPAATRANLGDLALAELVKVSGSPCGTVAGTAAMQTLARRINPTIPPRVFVVRDAVTTPLHLPGNIVVLPATLIESADGPDVIAGTVLAQALLAKDPQSAQTLLNYAGLFATMRLLGSGAITPAALDGYAEVALAQPQPQTPHETLLAAFKSAGLSSTAYAYTLDKSGEKSLALIEADPFPKGSQPPVFDDATWLNLQSICTG